MQSVSLPPELLFPPHLDAQKYVFVSTLTLVAWDTTCTPSRSWRFLTKRAADRSAVATRALYVVLRLLLVGYFVARGIQFLGTHTITSECRESFRYDPICTSLILLGCLAIHAIRICTITKNRRHIYVVCAVVMIQLVCAVIYVVLYRLVPLLDRQGCVGEPKSTWVFCLFWAVHATLCLVLFTLAIQHFMACSSEAKTKPLWYRIRSEHLNFYFGILVANVANIICWVSIQPTGPHDPIRTVLTPLTTAFTAVMTFRIAFTADEDSAIGTDAQSESRVIVSPPPRRTRPSTLGRWKSSLRWSSSKPAGETLSPTSAGVSREVAVPVLRAE